MLLYRINLISLLSIILLLGLVAGCMPSFAAPAAQAPAAQAPAAQAPAAQAPAAQAPAAPATLTVYARVTDITRDVEMQLISAFEARHQVKVNLVNGEDPDLYARFAMEEKNGLATADVFAGWNPVGTLQLEKAGVLQAYVPPALQSRIPERFRDPVVIQHAGLSALAYNPAKLGTIPPPSSFADLALPEYKDRIEMVDPIISTTNLKLVGHFAYSSPLGWAYWEEVQANGMRLVSQAAQVNKDIEDPASPVAVGIVGYGTAYPDERAGKPIKVVVPAEGLVAGEYVVAIASKAQHPDLARAFVDEVTFNPQLLDAWAKRYLPVTVPDTTVPPGTPPLDKIVITDWQLLQAKELEIKTQWQTIWSR